MSMPDEIYVVFSNEGSNFCTEIRQIAMDHCGECAVDFPDMAPWEVKIYHSDAKYKVLQARIKELEDMLLGDVENHQARIDELLAQQREACFMAYLDSDAYILTVKYSGLIADAIRNARIEK